MTSKLIDICHANVRSLNDDILESVRAELAVENDIIMLSETNLPHSSLSDMDITGFQHILRKDRVDRRGGGVAMYVASHLSATRMSAYEFDDLEAMWVKIKAGCNTFLFCVCYRPPNSDPNFWVTLQDSLDLARHSGINNIIFAGDFNSDPQTREGHLLNMFCKSNDLSCLINEQTRIIALLPPFSINLFVPQIVTLLEQKCYHL